MKKKKLLSIILSICVILAYMPAAAYAQPEEEQQLSEVQVNPVYEDELTEQDVLEGIESQKQMVKMGNKVYADTEEAGEFLREQIKSRVTEISISSTIPFEWSQEGLAELCDEIVDVATKHTGVPDEGDYLRWQYGGYYMGASGTSSSYTITLEFDYMDGDSHINYYSSIEQEQQVTAKVDEILEDLDLEGKCADEKVEAIYDYLTENVAYDHPGADDPEDTLCHTAYAALIENTAVCQGYALALYRLLLEEGVDCRLIAGDGGGPHAWNIIKVGDKWYNADATWDAGNSNYQYFLKTDADFPNHIRWNSADNDAPYDYDSAEFYAEHPMGTVNYDTASMGHSWVDGDIIVEAGCTAPGSRKIVCEKCGSEKTEEITPLGHDIVHADAADATCTKDGCAEHYECSRCGACYEDAAGNSEISRESITVAALGHNIVPHEGKAATCEEAGWKAYDTCSRCDYMTYEEIEPLGHDIVTDAAVPATCTETGLAEGSHCQRCGKVIKAQEVIPVKEHPWDEGTVIKEPTCTEKGTMEYACTACSEKKTEEIDALGHDITFHEAKAATCTETGLTEGSHCQRCGKVIKAQEVIPAKGHTWSPQTGTKATMSANGTLIKKCSSCGKSLGAGIIPGIASVQLAGSKYNYTGKNITPAVTVKDASGRVLVKGTDYTVAYGKYRNPGTAQATITFRGKYAGSKVLTYKINLKPTAISKLTKAKKAFTVKWKKQSSVTGYQIRYSLKSSMKGAKTVKVKGASVTSRKVKSLKKKKKYYVQIRTYKVINGTYYYSSWSGRKTVETK